MFSIVHICHWAFKSYRNESRWCFTSVFIWILYIKNQEGSENIWKKIEIFLSSTDKYRIILVTEAFIVVIIFLLASVWNNENMGVTHVIAIMVA